MTTMTLPAFEARAELELSTQPEPDDERYWITAAGAIALGREIDPSGRATLVAYSDELGVWVRIR